MLDRFDVFSIKKTIFIGQELVHFGEITGEVTTIDKIYQQLLIFVLISDTFCTSISPKPYK